ncbi:hypothetical protein FOCG_14182 [Fusarium oxysporum f. sp. radicis-lycopersici 26381]|uniref:Uncharacterized protein n=1 Tax=Fusarium oxysporum Fo47 TaxID=660027 RepID=W9LFL7_FUSOX|nr:hypothetical protein FOZG_01793 [Fusarium oxysporum Fo47]EWZ87089.1 hypothetical protein FOWG_10500 [Fusarium oxysporum f. sp. lycopersici MN25]EXL43913.1 hypothetical protein FOCG_14182 [Fusarium oxysporum f. sp. radicis-lycopersici 26381]
MPRDLKGHISFQDTSRQNQGLFYREGKASHFMMIPSQLRTYANITIASDVIDSVPAEIAK